MKPFAVSGSLLLMGLMIVLGGESAGKLLSVHPAFLILPIFCLYNLLLAKLFGLQDELRQHWLSPQLAAILGACLAAAVLIAVPNLCAIIGGVSGGVDKKAAIALKNLAITFCIVGWEELWFRGIAINYLAKRTSPVAASIFFSCVFVILHVMNPQIHLKDSAVNLFLASLMLSAGYFYFRSIAFSWVAHWIWNSASAFGLDRAPAGGWFWGENGFLLGLLLAATASVFLIPLRRAISRSSAHAPGNRPA